VIRFAIALLLAGTLLGGTVQAGEPVLRVRSRLRIDLESTQRIEQGLRVRGFLRDAVSQEPVPGRTVAISVEGVPSFYKYAEPTRDDGGFRWDVPLPPGEYTLRLAAGGDDDYEAAKPIERRVDVSRRTPVITLRAPEKVSAADAAVTVTVDALDPEDELSSARPAEIHVRLLVDGKPVTQLFLRGGTAEHALPVGKLGKPGARPTLRVRFDGDAQRNPADAERSLLVTTPTQLTLAGAGSQLPWRGSLRFDGALVDSAGPVAGETVILRPASSGDSEAEPLASAVTDEQGRFALELRGGVLPPGATFVEARYAPRVSWRDATRSAALPVTVLAPEPWPLAWYLSPLLTVLGLGGFQLMRKHPLRKLLQQKKARREAREATLVGFTESKKGILQTLRAPSDFGVSGQVCEHPTLQPVVSALLTVTAGGVVRELAVDEEGRFVVEGLPAGPVVVEVTARGYLPERFVRNVPHRGELRGARVLLVPLRTRIFGLYRDVAVPLLPRPQLAEIWTPRELLAHVRKSRFLADELAALTALVEEACFGRGVPDARVLAEVERLAAHARARTQA
jgi:hypothetical protein